MLIKDNDFRVKPVINIFIYIVDSEFSFVFVSNKIEI